MKDFVTDEGRIAFPYLAEPNKKFDQENDKREMTLVFPSTVNISKVTDEIQKAALEKWKEAKYRSLIESGKFNTPLKSNAIKVDDDDNPRPGFEDSEGHFIKFTSKYDIVIVDSTLKPIGPEDVKAGYWGRVKCSFKAYDNGANFGVSAYIRTLQVTRIDEEFGSSDPLEGLGIVAGDNSFAKPEFADF